MLDEKRLKLLLCPETRTPLTNTDTDLVAKLNKAIERGGLTNKAGRVLEKPIGGALSRSDGTAVYPIVDEIPLLLIEEAIPLGQL